MSGVACTTMGECDFVGQVRVTEADRRQIHIARLDFQYYTQSGAQRPFQSLRLESGMGITERSSREGRKASWTATKRGRLAP